MTVATIFRIVRFSKSDLEHERKKLIATYFSAYRRFPEYAYRDPGEVEEYLNWLFRGDKKGFFVARAGREIVGWMSVHDSWRGWRSEQREAQGELQELVVASEFQGQGLGRRLLALAIRHVAHAKRRSIGLYVGERNEPAKRLYERYGFTVESRWSIWLRMRRPIDPVVDEMLERIPDDPKV
ncbi:MAG: GNAT family N-acetyltransferase [Chloroflexota bacterium]|nr:GNAT family N-acetyltransferase [Dehalococcoidia bacterium]MDW8252278.1 GNAT family N-acetyltransferase [Chloroflexota bacterium]